MLQILLRDLSPIIYPLPSDCADTALIQYNAASYDLLTLDKAMDCWDGRMSKCWSVVGQVDWCANQVEESWSEWCAHHLFHQDLTKFFDDRI